MKTFIFSFLLCFSALFAQTPNLVVLPGTFTPHSILRGNLLTISARVQNTGTVNSPGSHLTFYLSKSKTITSAACVGCVSVEPLAIGAQSELKQIVIPIPPSLTLGNYYVGMSVDPFNEVTESDEKNDFFIQSPQLSIASTIVYIRHLPYPVLLIHGLSGNDQIWNTLFSQFDRYGWKYGGRMDYCLNFDGKFETSLLGNDVHDFTSVSDLDIGDFYTVNFDVNPDGTIYHNVFQSNQAAIFKQGKALQSAIKHVLDVTKSEKVIIAGHCMGGLAAREYLQNAANWQPDGQHHVAKLLTLGTPHGGSNGWTFGLEGIADEHSEAIRDLLLSYSNNSPGVFLFAGNENLLNGLNFYNNDVNCNGILGDDIKGLNKKIIPDNLGYSCIIGTSDLSSDGLVDKANANINNYYNVKADTFLVNEAHAGIPNNIFADVKGLDEPSSFQQAYRIGMDSLYYGFITAQNMGSSSAEDHDLYFINLKANVNLNLLLGNISVPQLSLAIYDSSLTQRFTGLSNGLSCIDTTISLLSGKYYLEIKAQPTLYSWMFPYCFKLHSSPSTNLYTSKIGLPNSFCLSQNYPNPFNPSTMINYQLPENVWVELKVFDILGREVATLVNKEQNAGEYKIHFEGANLPSGIYIYTIQAGQYRASRKLMLMK